ncbi:sensor histidine kinase [Mucilaginibacter psychrotolerans]|uniref:histidine kinase n=1 Tax=Mucilaginibacter psychrotolerans TaxID=1524096 RepID=A0A4Y8S9G2_9SPHI|nr:sensor histidine kinase [Mucilaginibacter psychrotolerans]TFF35331.1 HAMP domain-containing histidine kinase [Mucilaginibacter psychrotolerans]
MIKFLTITLENEMDLVLAHRRSMKVAEKLGLTVATQTTFATAVSEIARTVIEHTDDGVLTIGLLQNEQRYSLVALVTYDSAIRFTNADKGFYYAQKLVPEFLLSEGAGSNTIEMKIGLPRSLKLDPPKITALKKFLEEGVPINAYDEIKQRNVSLNRLAEEQEEELRRSKIIDEQKTEFISIASHEIKTPITVIKAYTQLGKKLEGECSDKVKDILNKVDIQTTKLLSLVQQLLDVSKIENGSLLYNKELVEFNSFITDMVAILQHILPQHTVTAILCQDITVYIDRLRMEQVFSNLIGNAAKYSKKGTAIRVTCSTTHDGQVLVAVGDEGIGMSAKSMESIFNKFYRDRDIIRTHSGLGMGLYISSKIIADHGGRIWVESNEGQGSTFFFSQPVVKSVAE